MCASPSMFVTFIEDILFDVPFHFIVCNLHVAHARGLIDAVPLRPFIAGSRVQNLVIRNQEVASQRLNVKAISLVCATVIQDFVTAKAIAMGAILESLFPEINARLAVSGNGVVRKNIVGVFVADGDAEFAVALDRVVFEAAVANAPA